MPSDKSLQAMAAACLWRGWIPSTKENLPGVADAAEVADRLVAEAVTEERQRILDGMMAADDDYDIYLEAIVAQKPRLCDGAIGTASAAYEVVRGQLRAIVNGTDQQ